MKETMTVHRALSELKLIDAKITKGIEGINPAGFKQGTAGKVGGVWDETEFSAKAQSDYDSVVSLMTRKVKLKTAIVKSNAATLVKIGTVEMSVADAIAMKSIVATKRTFIARLKATLQMVTNGVIKNNDVVKQNLQKVLEASFGKDNVKAGAGDVDAISKPFLDNNTVQLVDPLKVQGKIDALETEVFDFEVNVDATLSESNAVTIIEFE